MCMMCVTNLYCKYFIPCFCPLQIFPSPLIQILRSYGFTQKICDTSLLSTITILVWLFIFYFKGSVKFVYGPPLGNPCHILFKIVGRENVLVQFGLMTISFTSRLFWWICQEIYHTFPLTFYKLNGYFLFWKSIHFWKLQSIYNL